MTKKDNNIDKSYDFGKSEFNRKNEKDIPRARG